VILGYILQHGCMQCKHASGSDVGGCPFGWQQEGGSMDFGCPPKGVQL
jgi:hypothetical protein